MLIFSEESQRYKQIYFISPIPSLFAAVFLPRVPIPTPCTMGFSASIPLRPYSRVLQSCEAAPALHFQTSGLSQQLRKSAFYRWLSILYNRSARGHTA